MAHIFISYAREKDSEEALNWVSWLASDSRHFHTVFIDRTIPSGADWEREIYQQIKSAQAVLLIVTPNWHASKWCFAEFALARTFGKNIVPIIPRSAPEDTPRVSEDIQHFDARRDDWETARQALADDLGTLLRWDAGRSPFPGLLPFHEDDAAVFFGRDDEAIQLVEHLNRFPTIRFVALHGASGTGKSSLMRAGVIPRLKSAGYRDHWVVLPPFSPGQDPIRELARALTAFLADRGKASELASRLKGKDPYEQLQAITERCREKAVREAKILVSIDQAEELFYVTPLEARRAFLDLLSVLLNTDLPFFVFLALRSEYVDGLLGAVKDFKMPLSFPLAPLPAHRWREIIEGPATAAGLKVENALIDQVRADAETEDALPLLAVVLRTLYDKQFQRGNGGEGPARTLNLANYEALGNRKAHISPLDNTVREVADSVLKLHGNEPGAREALREAFVAGLAQLNDKGEFVRRRAEWEAMPNGARDLLDALTRQRLMVAGEEGGQKFIEVSHEALLRTWPTLKQWLEEERDFLAGRRRIHQALEDWARAEDHQKAAALLHGLLLERAREWIASHGKLLTDEEREFLTASISADDAARAHARRQQTKVFRMTVGGLAVVTVLAVGASYAAWQAMRQRDGTLITQSRLLSYLSGQATQAGDSLKGMLLSLDVLPGTGPSGNRPYTEEPELSLHAAFTANRQRAVLPHGDGAPIGLTLFSPDSAYVLTALGSWISSESAPARVWDTQTGAQTVALEGAVSAVHAGLSPQELADETRVQAGYARHLTDAQFSRDSKRLLTVLWHKTVKLWDLKSGAARVTFGYRNKQRIESARFSPDEAYVISEFTAGDQAKSPDGKESRKTFRLSDSATGAELDQINGGDGLKRMAFSPDGARMLTQDQQGRLTLWDAKGRQPTATLLGPQGEVTSLVFSPDGAIVAATATDGTAWVWNVASGKELGVFKGHEGSVDLARFSPSGDRLLTASSDKTARLWQLNPLKASPVSVFLGHEGAITDASFNTDGSRIITRSKDKTSRLWNTQTGETLVVFQVDKSNFGSSTASVTAEFSADGQKVLSYSDRLSFPKTPARVWSAETGEKLTELAAADEAASYSPDGTRILTLSGESGARLWDAFDGKPYASLSQPGIRLDHAAFSPDGKLAITVSRDTATLWDARTGAKFDARFSESVTSTRDHSGFEALSPDGKFKVQSIYRDKDPNTRQVLEVASDKPMARLEGHEKRIASVAFCSTGTRILTASEDGTARLWSSLTGKALRILKTSGEGFSGAEWSPDDRRIVTISNRGGVDLWDPDQGKHIAELGGDSRFSRAAWFNSEGSRLATAPFPDLGSGSYPVRIWNADSGSLALELEGHGNMVKDVVFSPDGRRVLTASADMTAKIWDGGTGELLATFKNGGEVERAEFNGDGTRVLIQTRDANIKTVTSLWNVETGERIAAFPASGFFSGFTKFTADGAYVVISSGGSLSGNHASLWDARDGSRLAGLRGGQNSDASREVRYRDDSAVIDTFDKDGNRGQATVLKGHNDRITDGHLSPDDGLAVTASEDGTIRLWDASSGNSKAVLRGHQGAVLGAVFSADGRRLISSGEDGTARIWEVSSGIERRVLKGHRGAVSSASLSQDGSRAVTIGEDRTLRQWDVRSGAQLSVSALEDSNFKDLAGNQSFRQAFGIAMTPDGTRVLAQGREKLLVFRTFPSTQALMAETMQASSRCLSLEERKAAYLEDDPPAWCIEQGKWPYHTLRWKAWLDAKRAGRNPAYPVAGQQVAAGAHEAFHAGRFEEALKRQGALAETFAQATTSIPGGEPATAAWVFAHLARYALFSKDYFKALKAADRAIELQAEKFLLVGTPDINAYMNKAHALMFLGRVDEARELHRKMRGKKIDVDGDMARLIGGQKGLKPTLWEDGVRADFERFRSLGMDDPNMAEIEKALAGSPPQP